jgi:hypothetical protein
MGDVLHAVASVLAGPSETQTVDHETGNITTHKFSRSERIANTAGIYLRGAAAGAAQHGPGAVGKAALAGVNEQQATQQQQFENTQQESKNVQSQLEQQGARVLQQQQIAESGFRMARLQTEMDDATAEKFNAMQTLLSTDPSNRMIGHFNSFADLTAAHPDLVAAGINLPQLQAQGKLRAVITTKGGKATGVDVFMVNPEWENSKISEPITLRTPMGMDTKGNVQYDTQVIPAGSISRGKALQTLGIFGKNALDAQEKAIQLKNQTTQVQNSTALGKSEIAKNYAESNLADTQSRALIGSQQADPFGNTSTLPQKELLKRQDAFQSQVVNKAYDVEKAYTMSQQAYAEYIDAAKQGKSLPTGAQSMLLLSQHLGTTFGNVKGSRITKDMIAEHLGARGLTDDAVTAIQRLVNGDQLSSAQWSAFTNLIGQSRNATWSNAVSNAKNQQLPITFLPRGNGKSTIDPNTAQIYLDAAGGDWQKATGAAQKQGWVIK